MRQLRLTTLFFLIISALAHSGTSSPLAVAANPGNGMITVLTEKSRLLYFDYYDWGPDWSGVHRNNSTSEADDQINFTYENRLARTDAEFTVEGFWKAIDSNQLQFEATLTPKQSSELIQAQFSLQSGEALDGGKALIHNSDGQFREVSLPFSRGLLGDDVVSIEFFLNNESVATLSFNQPTYISADRNEARIAIARDQIYEGQSESLDMTLTLSQPFQFYPGPESAPDSQAGWYPFEQNVVISSDSPLSMANWLDSPAGKYGRIVADGDRLLRNNNEIKLWGTNLSFNACAPNKDLADKRAAFYAAMGINSVRCHKYAQGPGWRGITSDRSAVIFDPEELDKFDYFISALKNHGIYTKLSPVFIINPGPDDIATIPYLNEFAKNSNGWYDPKHGSIYFSPELQSLLIEQFTNLLTHRNPYTGLTYAEDPAIVYVELYNEDSIFFHGTARALARSSTLRANAGNLFSQWLKNKYQTESAWIEAWGDKAINSSILRNQKIPTDENWSADRIYPIGNPWFFDPENISTSQSPFKQRLYDTMEFLHKQQNDVYDRLELSVRETGYTGEIISSNWVAGRQMSHFYNLYSDSRIGTIDRHNYFGGASGPYHSNSSMLSKPGSGILSSGLHQVADKPFMLSEWIHTSPNEWAVEGVSIIGAYGMGLQGWDASYAFQNRDTGSFSPALRDSWDVTAPNFIGLFPAVSRQVLRGDIHQSGISHTMNVHLPSFQEGKVGFELREITSGDIKSTTIDAFPSEGLGIVRSQIKFTDVFEETTLFNPENHRVSNGYSSSTDELIWIPGDSEQSGFITIDTAATQAVIGFAENKLQTLSTSQIELKSNFGAVYLTAESQSGTLDSDNILITAISRARNAGASIIKDRFILSAGTRSRHQPTGPVLLEPVIAEINFSHSNIEVYALDHSGVVTETMIPVGEDGSFTINTGLYKTPYYWIKKLNH
ncbi:glycoside hydrolase family 5 protein [Nitrincola iocasae]|uniref:Glycoside hydrolase family 42 N-terminal domain-containing protein n=1 Tax=Nitrincola iocasae TaxID=2614693 RepID=A0A5J6LD52_9GAMM|nr:hypothetical protein [Nitrincola iocasae]QEW06258.1 hypothetical protein F5I99_06965 [Nitrincola iocasae]